MSALGGLLLALRAGGASAGWAFQLQDPRVIVVLLLLVTGIAFNLAGLFELATPGAVNTLAANGKSGAFATGALAAFVATPCTGPFMGAALGAALVLPTAAALLVFAGLGLGIALPFLALGFVPALRRRLPKPGAWMETMRRILSVPMFLTALALAWVLGRQAGVDGMTLGLAAAALLTFGLWWSGMRQAKGSERVVARHRRAAGGAGCAVALVERAPAQAAAAAGHEAFSEARLASLRAAGPAGVRLFHRRLVPDVQGQREGGDRDRRRRARRSRTARWRCWSATGPTATRRWGASSKAQPGRRAAVPLVCRRKRPTRACCRRC